MKIIGHHHISMYAKDLKKNIEFYTETLGLRLVEKSINQDSPTMYHFFYGDEVGTPGTLLSFFDMPMAGHTYKGTNSIYRLSLLLPSAEALSFYKDRLTDRNIEVTPLTYVGQDALLLEDFDGLEIVLINNDGYEYPTTWKRNSYSDIPQEYQILGMGPVELRVANKEKTTEFLTETLGFTERNNKEQYTIDKDGLYGDFVVVEQDGDKVKPGRGYVHHIALHVSSEQDLLELIEKFDQMPGNHSGIVDRFFFKALYYRHNGIMYEFSTTEPGFLINTTVEDLGKKVVIPEFMEYKREEIESKLRPLK